jgi:hypothetical protein
VGYEGREGVGPPFLFSCMLYGSPNSPICFQLSNDPSLSSLPLLSTFLKSYSRPFLGLAAVASKQVSEAIEPGALSADIAATNGAFPELAKEEDELVEKEIRDRFKKMCEGYFDNVSKKLVMEHKVGLRLMIDKFAR